jgi:PAS domain-containing protein
MGEPERSDAPENDRRSAPRFPAELLGKASVRLLGGSEVTLINFSERGILFQSETRLLVGARGTVRIIVGSETTIAAGTVVRSLVQGMASGKLAFHTALALDQPLPLATAVAARERAKLQPVAPPAPPPVTVPIQDPPPAAVAEAPAPAPAGKTIEKRSHQKGAERRAAEPAAPVAEATPAAAAAPTPQALEAPAPPPEPPQPASVPVQVAVEPPALAPAPASPTPAAPATPIAAGFGDSGFGDSGFGGTSFGWADTEAQAAGLSVLFVSTTKERTARLQQILAGHKRDITLATLVHAKVDALVEVARQHDVLLFDFAIGPEALERMLAALRTSPLGASIAVFVPQQTALPPAVSSLANACVVDTTSGDLLAAALRDAAWTPWQPVETTAGTTPHDELFWKAFDALPVPVIGVDRTGTIAHANGACLKLANGVEIFGRELASFFVPEDAAAIARLIADGFAGGHEDTPVFTATAEGKTVQVMLQALSVLPASGGGQPELALRCELRPEAVPEPEVPPGPDLAVEVAILTEARDELVRDLESARAALAPLREDLDEARGQVQTARRERDELRGQLEIAQRDLDRSRELERTAAARIVELEKTAAGAAHADAALGKAHREHAALTDELQKVRGELEAARGKASSADADAERNRERYTQIEAGARQALDELKAVRAEAQKLARERDEAVAAAVDERKKAEAALAAVRDDAKKSRRIGAAADDAQAHSIAKLGRLVDELRAELKHEQEARKELEELLDQNADNLEQTIQDYEARLEALAAGETKSAVKPKKTRQG